MVQVATQRFGELNWPPRSGDLKSLNFFLWGYVKSSVDVNKPETFEHQVIAEITARNVKKRNRKLPHK